MVSEQFDSGDNISKAAMDETLQRLQQGVRRMRPLVMEQQPERDMRFPRPAMVVQERCSRSSYLERMEKRWIQRKARLEMLEEIKRMIDRWDEEDAAKKKSQEEETLAAEDSNLGHVEGSVKSFCPLTEPIHLKLERKKELPDDHQVASQKNPKGETLICWDKKVEPYFERGKDARKKLLETKREKCAHHVFDQMAEGGVRVTKKKKRWKKLSPDLQEQLEAILSNEENDKSELWGIQIEGASKSQRKRLLKWCKGISSLWVHTRQRLDRRWLLLIRGKKWTESTEDLILYGRSEQCVEAERVKLREMVKRVQCHMMEDVDVKRNKKISLKMKLHHIQELDKRLLVLKVTEKKKTSTRREQHGNKCIKSIKTECRAMRKVKRYEMKRSKLELEQMRLMQRHERVLRKLGKWMKNKFKQKNQWGWIEKGSLLNKSRKFLAAIMKKRAKFQCVTRGKLPSSNQTLFFWNTKLMLDSFRMNLKGWCKRNHFGRVCLKNKKWLKLNDIEKMGCELLLATYTRRRAKWNYIRCICRKLSSLDTAIGVKFYMKISRPELEQEKLFQELKRVQKKLKRCRKHKFKQKNHKEGIKLNSLLILIATELRKDKEVKWWRCSRANLGIWSNCFEKWGLEKWGSQCELKVWDPGLVNLISCARGDCESYGWKLLGAVAVSLPQFLSAFAGGTKGCVIWILLFETLMKASCGNQKVDGINSGGMELCKVTETVASFGSWMGGRLTLITNRENRIQEVSRDKFRMRPFEKNKFMIFTCDWMQSPRPPELLLCSSHETAIQDCRGASLGKTFEEKLRESQKGSMIKNLCCYLVPHLGNYFTSD